MDELLTAAPSPLQELDDPLCRRRGVRLFVKRDEERFLSAYPGDRSFGGNKWRKLQYNLMAAREQKMERLLTLGGAYSNHLAATAAAGLLFGFETIGLVRGEAVDNPTLQHARRCGMTLHFLDRATYRERKAPEAGEEVRRCYGPAFVLPEGGTNAAALRGCAELAEEISAQLETPADYIALAVGTGGTMAGLVTGLKGAGTVLGFSVLRGGAFLEKELRRWISQESGKAWSNWKLITDFHYGGYAKFTPELIAFINDFRRQHGIQLDPIYTGKLFYGLFTLIEQGFFPAGARVVAIHSGGLQGIQGHNQRFGRLLVDS